MPYLDNLCLCGRSSYMWKGVFVLLIIFSVVLYIAVQLPYSFLYKKYHTNIHMLESARHYNTERLKKAVDYFEAMVGEKSLGDYRDLRTENPQIVICIVSVGRSTQLHQETGYLLQSAAVMDHLVKTDTHFTDKILFICNVDDIPNSHRDAKFLERYIPYVQRSGKSSFKRGFPDLRYSELYGHKTLERKKELEDYVFCLNASLSFQPRYVLMIEDDAMAYPNMFKVLNFTLEHKLHYRSSDERANKMRPFSFLKLYYPERWQGFAFEFDRVLELFSIGVIGAGFFSLLMMSMNERQHVYRTNLLYFIGAFSVTVLITILIGRQNVVDLRRVSPQLFKFGPSPQCCTPAMFYNADILPGLLNYLLINTTMNKDLAIHEYIENIHMPGYLLEPNLFHHLGMFTSLSNKYKPPEEFMFM